MKSIFFILLIFLAIHSAGAIAHSSGDSRFYIADSEVFSFESTLLGRTYDVYVKTPRGYRDPENKNRKYPVLYLNDGPHTFKVAAGVTHFPTMDKVIIVGISFAQGEDGQLSRVRDLTPEVDASWTRYKTGGAPEYLAFIEQELFPHIERRYRTNTTKRILAGHSLGGSFGAWVLMTKPELFSGYILTSPSFWYKDELIFDLERAFAKNHTTLNAMVYVATGSLEVPENGMRNNMVDGHRRFLKQLRASDYRGLMIRDEIVEGTDHYSTFPVGLAKGLNMFYQQM